MKDKVINNLIINIKKENPQIDKVKLEEIKYGLLGLYSLITKTLIIIIFSFILGLFKEFIIFFIFYSFLRSVGFGVHAKTNIQCWIFSTLFLVGLPYLFSNITLNIETNIIIWIICFINYIIFCPADTENRPMINKKRKLIFKLLIISISIIYLILLINFKYISNLIIASLILEALLTNPLGYILMGQKVRFKLNNINFNLIR